MTTPAWLDRIINVPCTVYLRTPSGSDEYGNVVYIEDQVDTFCFLQPATQQEIEDGRADFGEYLVHLPADIVGLIDGFARVDVNGISYEAAGPPAVYPFLRKPGIHHVEIAVSRSTA